MEAELQAYYDSDPGFAQFVDRHQVVAAMPDIRKAYRRWEYDIMLDKLDEERRAAAVAAIVEARLAEKDAELAEKDAELAKQAAEIERLLAQLKQ